MSGPAGSVDRRRVLEALRAGVPNRDAVAVLGSMQQGVEGRFSRPLAAVRALPEGPPACGVLIRGGFGTGKSHVLEHLAHTALAEQFVVSKVVVSKETPLYDPVKVYRAAIEQAKVPGRPGSAIDEIAADGWSTRRPRTGAWRRWRQRWPTPSGPSSSSRASPLPSGVTGPSAAGGLEFAASEATVLLMNEAGADAPAIASVV